MPVAKPPEQSLSHKISIRLTPQQYAKIKYLAAQKKTTPVAVFRKWLDAAKVEE